MLVFLSVTSIHFLFVFIHTFVLFFIHFFGIIFHCVLYISSITVIWIFYLEFAIPPPFRSRVLHLSFDIHKNMKSIYWIMPSNKSSNKWQKKNLNKKSITSLVLNNWCWKYICMWLITEGKNPQNQNKTKCWSKYMSHYFFIHWIFAIPESRIERMKRLMWSTKLNLYKYHRECPKRWRRKHSSGVNLLLASNAM